MMFKCTKKFFHTQSFQGLSLKFYNTKDLLKILHRDFEKQKQLTVYPSVMLHV